jgi:hypothetical protein
MSEYQEEITEDVSPHQEAAMREAFGLNESEPEPEDAPEEAPEPEEKPEPTPDPEESSAKQHGWTTKAEWVAQGKNPDDWVNAKHFNEKGRLINESRLYRQEKGTFDQRLQNVKILFDAQIRNLKTENAQLLQAKKEAVTYGDFEAVQKIDAQLMDNAVNQLAVSQAANADSEPAVIPQALVPIVQDRINKEVEWNRSNAWIHDGSEKANFAIQLYNQLDAQDPYSTFETRLKILNAEVEKKFPSAPKTNPNRDKAPVTDARSARSTSSALTMADLTPAERKDFDAFGVLMYGNGDTSKEGVAKAQKLYLKTIQDIRRG